MEIKQIVVCGDSFCTSVHWDRLHFSQILADKYNFEVINLAHGSFSNLGICFQIREAISMKPDIIVYNTTDYSRFELVMHDKISMENGLKNIMYFQTAAESYSNPHTGNLTAPIFSTNYQRLADIDGVSIRKDQKEAVDTYLKYFFNDNLKKETDSWAFGYWHQQIINAGIIPLRVSREDEIARPMYEYARANPKCSAYYHTDKETQEIIAKNINDKLKKGCINQPKNVQ